MNPMLLTLGNFKEINTGELILDGDRCLFDKSKLHSHTLKTHSSHLDTQAETSLLRKKGKFNPASIRTRHQSVSVTSQIGFHFPNFQYTECF
ncbi:LOW QUALITY PROTEIN: hypothetical protein TorRG33x02_022990 [Trema orientale]|uniref:Uncharacterized protein n=1 Tax=Trema orientale TaxID=63057 RepID=A0A2P5FW73_TREOI|nr:LOW QUALITY PROTEIN: hypothetical protein TorRG33x02_022990 [Trema orientale]